MDIQTLEIVRKANRLANDLCTRDLHRIAQELGIEVIPLSFKKQRGAYKVLMRNRFIFIKDDLHPVMERIVLLHEIGHDALHREEAVKAGGFKEFNIFDMRQSRMEYEANIFASQISLPDDEILEYIENGYDIQQIARAMHSDINLVALKTDTLIAQGYRGYTSALKAPVRCFGNHLSGKRKSWFRTDNECGGAAILKNRTSRMGTPVGC